jgi:hypothetical protein
LGFEDVVGALAHGLRVLTIPKKACEGVGEAGFAEYGDRVLVAQEVDYFAEVGVVRTHEDGYGELSGFERVVSSGFNEAASNESCGGEGVDGCQFPD